ncbi:MAG: asparaginase domain-containing protein [Methylococcaceae bacterium]|nr:asparaginase domain-containing protein [Methylococcaceae bacterium]
MKSILLVFTGGTIGSKAEGGTINTSDLAGYKLLQLFAERHGDPASARFKTLQPLRILSENLHPKHWRQLIAAIEDEGLSGYDGVIVTHGTDTLAFSAAVLGLYFNRLNIPMLLVSSDLPLDNPDANGLPNFLTAVEFIRQIPQGGVFVSYKNPGQIQQIHLATRLASCLQLGSDFISVQNKPFMHFEGGCFRRLHALPELSQPVSLKADFSARILLIRPYPGLDYSQFSLDGVDAVLHDLYHSGTACASAVWGENHNLVEFIKRCRQRNLKIYLAPAIKSDSVYGSTRELLAAGAEMIWNLSLEAAYAKLLLAYGNFDDPQAINRFLAQDNAWEHV